LKPHGRKGTAYGKGANAQYPAPLTGESRRGEKAGQKGMLVLGQIHRQSSNSKTKKRQESGVNNSKGKGTLVKRSPDMS